MQGQIGGRSSSPSAFLKASTTTLFHTISESEKATYVAHINSFLEGDGSLSKYLPIDPMTDDLFEKSKDGVLLWTIDEWAINMKRVLNLWEKNENHMLRLNSAKAIGCTVVNIGTQDLAEGRYLFLIR